MIWIQIYMNYIKDQCKIGGSSMKEDEFEKINAIDVKIEIQDLTSKLGVVNSKMLVSAQQCDARQARNRAQSLLQPSIL